MKVNGSRSGVAPSAPPTRRTQAERTAATRALLIDAARKLFADKGFADVSTQAIVEAAGKLDESTMRTWPPADSIGCCAGSRWLKLCGTSPSGATTALFC